MRIPKKSVFIVGGNIDYEVMFQRRGWDVVSDMDGADLVQFTGGADVSPSFYNKRPHPTTHNNPARDFKEKDIYKEAQANKIKCAGICRGSQFLHVMAGGELVQDCNNHAIGGTHPTEVAWMPGGVRVTSTHHQMMGNPDIGMVLMWTNLSTYKETMENRGKVYKMPVGYDIEAMYYPQHNSLSYQPHPEFSVGNDRYDACADAYFFMIENYLFGDE